MGILADIKKYIYSEEVDRNKGVSQSTWRKIGGAINFILHRTHEVKRFTANGAIGMMPADRYPFNFVDGVHVFEFDIEIFNIWTYITEIGASGLTELDIKIAAKGSNVWTSILSTTAKIGPTASAGVRFELGDTGTGITAPVVNGGTPLKVLAGTAIRMDLVQAMKGSSQVGMIVHFRPT